MASTLAIVIIAIATPVAGAIGTSVHGARSLLYAEELKNRHQVVATAMEDTTSIVLPTHVEFEVRATWSAVGRAHDEIVGWAREAKSGDREAIWVDGQGDCVGPPSPLSRAARDAVGVALAVWVGVIVAAAGAMSMIRRRLDHGRYTRWEHEINATNDRS
jgi:hypothetical protein